MCGKIKEFEPQGHYLTRAEVQVTPSTWDHALALDYSDHEQSYRWLVKCGTCGRDFDGRENGDCREHTECPDCSWEALPAPCLACLRRAEHEKDFASFDGAFGIGLAFACPMILCTREGEHEHRVRPVPGDARFPLDTPFHLGVK